MSNPAIIKLQEATRFSFDRDLAAGPDEKPKKQEEKKTFSEEQVEQIRAEAYAAGSEAARADEELELSRQIAAGANLVADQLGKLLENLRSERAHLREEAADIALTIARKLVPALMDTAPAAEIENVLVHAFALLRDEPRVVVHVTPDQLDLLEPRINEIASEHGFEGRLIVRVDEEIALGDVRIEWSKGHITRDTPALDSEIETIVRTYLSAPGTDDNGQTDFFALLGKQ
ncbi:FliH/SctL family protein [Pyruvatibacter mobilis]|uniref:FliH/SctL family protein n=1 Tax=Pyruvatibacter mobilis TaxID=1712261 RepID=UPI003BACCCDE